MKKHSLRGVNATSAYILLQATAWSFYAIIMSFSSNVLRDFGFSDSRISLVLGLSTVGSFALQLILAELISRFRRWKVYGVMLILGSALLLINLSMGRLPKEAAIGAFSAAIMLLQLLPPFANAMGMDAIENGSPTNYSLARGMGSLAYSFSAYLTGMLVRRNGTGMVPLIASVCAILFLAATGWYHLAEERHLPQQSVPKRRAGRDRGFLRQYPRFAAFLAGAIFLHLSHSLLSNFMYQIMLSKGGNSAQQGIATSICALVELPIMFGFPLMLKAAGCDKWIRITGFGMAIKALALFLATSPQGVHAAQATQIIGYGLYAISSVHYAALVVGKGESVRAQSYLGSTTTVGTLIALSTGGVICQHFGTQTMVLVSLVCALIGGSIILLSAQKTTK